MPSLHVLLSRVATLLVPLSVAVTVYLYLYPLAHQCSFPTPPAHAQDWIGDNCTFGGDEVLAKYYSRRDVAPFRLLALGDPQLEGDSSLPSEVKKQFPGFETLRQQALDQDWQAGLKSLKFGVQDVWAEVVTQALAARKRIDLLGNDFYLAHIYRTLYWWTEPTHVSVLGDLLGSQWIKNDEFQARADRFWHRVFRGAEVVPLGVMRDYKEGSINERAVEILGADAAWKRRIINVVGNHDIGYAGDIRRTRVERFERAFGNVNGDVRFTLPINSCSGNTSQTPGDSVPPTLRIVVLNSMNLDGPVIAEDLQQETYSFINSVIEHSDPVGTHETSTILLTHIPLHKDYGTCVDAPFFSYFKDLEGGGVREQNMISKDLSASAILQALFGKSTELERAPAGGVGRDGIILTGHDHEGCDVYHFVDDERREWTAKVSTSEEAVKAKQNDTVPGIREVTVRSMMGEFGGYAALVSAWWNANEGKWEIELERCSLGVQHVWWAVHIVDLITLVVLILLALTRGARKLSTSAEVASGANPAAKPRVKQTDSPSEKKQKASPPKKKKSSAFSKRFQQSVEDGRTREAGGSEDGRRKKKTSTAGN